jgi:four helix bundle protein
VVSGEWSRCVVEDSRYKLDDFELYQVAREFRKRVYSVIRHLPAEEKYCLGNQMRRAAVSITNNIADGHGRWHYQENIQFCRIARGSVEEILDDLSVCIDENYVDQARLADLKVEGYSLLRRLNGYVAYLRRTKQGQDA